MDKSAAVFLMIIAVVCFSTSKLVVGDDGWVTVDPKDPTAVDAGKFAISQHNKEAHTDLEFKKLTLAYMKPGKTYFNLTIAAKKLKAAKVHRYNARVAVFSKYKQLLDFKNQD